MNILELLFELIQISNNVYLIHAVLKLQQFGLTMNRLPKTKKKNRYKSGRRHKIMHYHSCYDPLTFYFLMEKIVVTKGLKSRRKNQITEQETLRMQII